MAWYKCIGSNSGGGGSDNNRYTYVVQTTSMGSSDASVSITQYRNNIVVDTVNVDYRDVQSSWETLGDLQIGYPNDWVLKVSFGGANIIYNGTTYLAGEQISTWTYNTYKEMSMNSEPPVGQLTIEKIEKSDWDILLNKDNNTLYLVTADNRPDVILYQYQGDNRLSVYKQDLSDYEFWYENMSIADYPIDTNVVIGGANYSRPWQIELNMGKRANLGECCFISFNESSTVEVYYSSGSISDTNLKIYGGFFGRNGDVLTNNFENAEIIIKYENNAITVTTNGTQTYTTSTYYDMGTKKIRLFSRGQGDYKASGFINYIGFKWLD